MSSGMTYSRPSFIALPRTAFHNATSAQKGRKVTFFYQRAVTTSKPIPSHKNMKVSFVLSSELRQKVFGEYRRLTSDKLLSACLLSKTQNVNEHLHSRIWRYCSKYTNANKNILEYAIGQAVLDYNVGFEDGFVLPRFAPPFTKIQQESLQHRDRLRERTRETRKRKQESQNSGDYRAGSFKNGVT